MLIMVFGIGIQTTNFFVRNTQPKGTLGVENKQPTPEGSLIGSFPTKAHNSSSFIEYK